MQWSKYRANMSQYVALSEVGFREASAYRFDAAMTVVSSGIFLLLYYMVWESIAASGTLTSSVTEIMAYMVLGQVISNAVFVNVEPFIGAKVRKGTIVNELKRPISFRMHTYTYFVGRTLFNVVSKAAPVIVLGILFLNVPVPNVTQGAAFLFSLFLGYNMVFSLAYATGMLVFWTKVEWSLRVTRNMMQNLFSGVLFPLYLLPAQIRDVFNYLPFHAMADAPINIFLGNTTGTALLHVYGIQLFWTLVILVAGELLWHRAKQNLSVQGG